MAVETMVKKIDAVGLDREGYTFIVANDGTVYYTGELTRHLSLMSRTSCQMEDIAWGGILNDRGDWVRRSYDFGDAPTVEIRNAVISAIQEQIYA